MLPERRKWRGFSVVAALFLLVVLALLGAAIVSVIGVQQASGQLDLLGVRAYHSARAGLEWGARSALDPDNTLNPATCSPVVMPSCPVSPTNLNTLAASLSAFTVTVTCTQTADTTEGNRSLRVFTVVATACNQPDGGGACPNPAPTGDYVERQLQAALAKCKDSTALAPRCDC